MALSASIALILLGILGASSMIIKNKPEAKDLIDKLVPFQGWIGIIGCLWGIGFTIWSFTMIGWAFALGLYGILWFAIYLGTGVFSALLGFIFGYGLINKFALSKASDEIKAKAEETLQKLLGVQTTMGIIAIIIGIVSLVWYFIPVTLFL